MRTQPLLKNFWSNYSIKIIEQNNECENMERQIKLDNTIFILGFTLRHARNSFIMVYFLFDMFLLCGEKTFLSYGFYAVMCSIHNKVGP